MAYEIRFTDDGLRDVKALPKNAKNSLQKALREKVATDPEACSEELREPLAGLRSFHFGKYRVVFKFYADSHAIAILGIGQHSRGGKEDIYKRLEVLASQGKLAEHILHTLRGFSKL